MNLQLLSPTAHILHLDYNINSADDMIWKVKLDTKKTAKEAPSM